MSIQDPLADLLTRIRNAQLAKLTTATMPSSKLKVSVCKVLQQEGYINGYEVGEKNPDNENDPRVDLTVTLKYGDNNQPAIEEIRRVSRPGLRIYATVADIPRVHNGLGIAVMSTNQGIVTNKAARRAGIGGEVLCTVF